MALLPLRLAYSQSQLRIGALASTVWRGDLKSRKGTGGGALAEHEKEIIETALADCEGHARGPTDAAAKLRLPRQTLESKIAALGINKHRFKTRQADYAR
jgi:DNA-binding NtrC family response regulator